MALTKPNRTTRATNRSCGRGSGLISAAVPPTACAGELPVSKDSSEQRLGIGNLKLRNGDYDGAIADFTRAIELEPGNSREYLMRGNAKKQKHDYAGAIADYTRALELEREYKDVMYAARAGVRELTGDLDGAIADYTRAIKIDPKVDGTYRSIIKVAPQFRHLPDNILPGYFADSILSSRAQSKNPFCWLSMHIHPGK